MSGMMRAVLVCLLAGGCALLGQEEAPRDTAPQGEDAADGTDAPAEPGASHAAAPQAGTAPETPAPTLPATTIASLGDVARPGLWMRTPLVTAPMRGRVSDPGTGASVVLDLIPLDAAPGAGSRMSLAAYQALGLSFTDLPELRIEPAG